LVLGNGQSLGVGDGEDGDPLVGAAILAADDRIDAPIGDLARGGQPLPALPRGARVVGDADASSDDRLGGAAASPSPSSGSSSRTSGRRCRQRRTAGRVGFVRQGRPAR
jgi:hypothetical protein